MIFTKNLNYNTKNIRLKIEKLSISTSNIKNKEATPVKG